MGEMSFCYDLVEYGNNFFRNSEEVNKRFSAWMELAVSVSNQIKALLKSDRERFENWGEP